MGDSWLEAQPHRSLEKLKQLIAREPDLTLAEMKGRVELNCTVAVVHWVAVVH